MHLVGRGRPWWLRDTWVLINWNKWRNTCKTNWSATTRPRQTTTAIAGAAYSPLLTIARLDSRGRMFPLLTWLNYSEVSRQGRCQKWLQLLWCPKHRWRNPMLKGISKASRHCSAIHLIQTTKSLRRLSTTGSPPSNGRQTRMCQYSDRQSTLWQALTNLCLEITEKPLPLKIVSRSKLNQILIITSLLELKPN